MSLLERLTSPSPKKILALDGGGIRGAISVGILEKVEEELASQLGRGSDFRLSDHFDLIIGTSTGSIIAGSLAIGMSVSEVKDYYLELGGKVFQKRGFLDLGNLKSWFKKEELDQQLESVFGDITFGSDELKTGLCVVTKRADTGSTWPVINHPNGKFYGMNKDLLVRQVIRASTAAPTYFEPEIIPDIGGGEPAAFVDGGISMANNPALLAFLLCTLKGFPFDWQLGADQLYLLSIGTGSWQDKLNPNQVTDNKIWNWAGEVPTLLMNDANWQNQLLLQSISKSLNPVEIDMEIGTAAGDLCGAQPLLTYVRYEVELQINALAELGIQVSNDQLKSLREMSDASNREQLYAIGKAAGNRDVEATHFPPNFNQNQ